MTGTLPSRPPMMPDAIMPSTASSLKLYYKCSLKSPYTQFSWASAFLQNALQVLFVWDVEYLETSQNERYQYYFEVRFSNSYSCGD